MPDLHRSQGGEERSRQVASILDAGQQSLPTGAESAAEEDLAAARATLEAAQRKVRVAELVQQELTEADAKASALADAEDKLLAAVARYEAAERAVTRAEQALSDVREAATQPVTVYENADDWFRGWLLPTWRRRGDLHWCAKWWLHAEAVSRIEAIWRAWEVLRLEALGPSVWWRDHADYHLAVLTSPGGPFAGCNAEKGRHQIADAFEVVPNPATLAQFL